MADQANNDKEFEEFLTGKTGLSNVYQHSTTQGPSEFTDKAILNAAKQEVASHSSGTAGKYRWHIPVTVAAGLVMAVIIFQVVPTTDDINSEIQVVDSTPVNKKQVVAAAKAGPDRLLEKIATHLKNNDPVSAKAEYKVFRDLFPKHEIDYKKYPELKALAE